MPIPGYTLDTVDQFVGKELGVSGWVTVGQDRIDQFADATGDHQWIHVDVEWAARESPAKSTIAHGFLTLSALAGMRCRSAWCWPAPASDWIAEMTSAADQGDRQVRRAGGHPGTRASLASDAERLVSGRRGQQP